MENKSQQTVLPDSASLDIPVTGTTTVIDAISDQALPSSNDLSLEPVTVGQSKSVRQPNSTSILLRFVRRADVLLVFIFILASILVFFLSSHHKPSQSPQASLSATSNFNTVKLPLSGLTFNQSPAESSNASVTINGPLLLNDSLQLTPSLQPTGAKPGQIYFDSSNGQLAYYNGQNFVFLSSAGPTGLQSLGGATGQVNLGSGLGINNGALSNTGVLSFQGRTGSVALTAGPGLVINGTNLSNGGVLSVSSTSPNITVTNDGSGHINLSLGALPGTGTVTSSGGNSGSIPVYTGSQNIEDSIVTQSGLGITVSGDLNVTGNVNFTNPLPVSSGGTGLSSLPLYGVLVGQGPGPVNSLTAGSSGLCLLSTSGSPIWATCPSATGGVVTSINNLNGDLTLANVSAVGNNITIDNATSTSKGIASFNGTNFSVIGGAVNTAQNIASSATPTFAGLDTNTITPSAAFTLGNTAQSFTLQGSAASELLVSNGANTTQLTFANPTANVTYRLPAANVGTYDICTSAGNCLGPVGSGANTALSNLTGVAINTSLLAGATTIDLGSRTAPFRDLYLGGTATNNFRFTGTPTAARTITIPDASGTLAISASSPLSLSANGNLSITNPVAVAFGGTNANTAATARSNLSAAQSGVNNDISSLTDLASIVPATALNIGATNQTLTLQGGPSTTLVANNGSFSTILAFGLPTANVTYNLPAASAGAYDICTSSGNCLGPGGSGANTALSNLSGVAINVSLATGNSSVDLGSATAPFRDLYLGGTATNNFRFTGTPTAARTITIPDASGTLAISATSPLSLSAGGNLSITNPIPIANGGTNANSAATARSNLSAAQSGTNNDITSLTDLTSITPSAALTVGATTQTLALQGGASTTLSATSGSSTTQLAFETPTANVTYNLQAAAAGTYDICTTAGNCLGGSGGGANTSLSNLSGVAINVSLATGNSSVDLGTATAPFRSLYLGSGSNNFHFTGTPTAARTITIPDASGTLAVSANAPLQLSASGALSCPSCLTSGGGGSGGVSSINSLNGALNLNGTTSDEISVNNNSGTGTITLSLPQGIASTSSPTFAAVNTNSIIPSSALTIGSNAEALTLQGSSGTILEDFNGAHSTTLSFTAPSGTNTITIPDASGTLAISASSPLSLSASGNLSITNPIPIANGGTNANSAATARSNLSAAQSGTNNDITSLTDLTSITPSAALTVGATSQTLTLQGNASTELSAYDSGFATNLSFVTPTSNVTYRLQTATAGTYDICTTAGNCLGGSSGGANTALSNLSGVAINVSLATGNSSVDLGTATAPFRSLYLGSGSNYFHFTGTSSGTDTITIPDASGTLAISASSPLSLSASGNLSITNPIPIANGGTNANSAATARSNLSAAQSGVNNDITSLTDLTSITPPSTLTLGSTNQTLTLQGGASTTLSATSGSFTTQLAFGIPTANVTYNLQTAAAGSYDICTTAGNCLGGSSGGANTALSNLSGVAINVSLATGNSSVDLGSASHPFRDLYLGGTTTNNFHFTGSATAARTITIPDNSGTLAVAASGNIALSGTGNLTITGQIPLANGGTGTNNTYNQYGVIYSNSANFVSTAAGSSGQCLVGQNSAAPTWTSCATGTNITLQAAYNMSGSTPLITTTASNKGFVLQAGSGSNSTSLFGANNANGASLFSVDSVNSIVNLFSNSSATGNDTGTWTTNGTNLYASLYYASSVTANGYIYEIGGYTSSAATANVYYAPLNSNGSVGSWTQTSSLPAAEGSCKAVTANGYIYDLCGTVTFYAGINSNGTLTSWSTSSSVLPGGSYAGETTANGYLYVNTGNTTNLIYSAALHADGSIGAWTQTGSAGALSVTISGSPGTFIANGYLYMIGGATSSPAGWTGGAAGTCYYAKLGSNGTVGAWSGCTSSMTFGRAAATTVVENGYVYVIDGYQDYAGTTTYPNSTLYAKLGSSGDITSWNTSANALPAFRQYSTSVVANGYIYELGGYDSGGTTQNSVYYASTNRVQVASSLDLTGSVGQGLVPGNSDASGGGEGGSLTADNGTFVGSLQVEGQSNLEGSANVNGTLMVRPTVDSTSAFQVQNASGGSLLNVDTTNGLIGVENLSPLLSTVTQPTITTIDPTDTYGQFSATAIGQDGFARIAYGHNGAGGLKFAQCTNDACTSPNITTVESANQALATSIAIGNDGYARIAYWVNGTGLEYAQCTNAACTTSNITTVDNNNSQTGEYNSIAIGPDGYPRISYIDGVNRYLKFAQCLNDACTSTNITNVDTSGNIANGGTSLAMGTDGFARIAYYNSQAPSSQKVEYAICLNATCSSNNKFAMTSTGTQTQYAVRLALSATNVPYVAYQTTSGLYYAVCNLASCSTGFTTTTVDSSTAGVDYLSIVIGADGYPRIAYNDSAANGGEIKLASCTPSCSITVIDAGPDAGSNTPVSLYLTSDERAHITYFNGLTLQLKFAIQNTPAAEATLGSNIGSNTNYFNQAYLSRINLQGALLINNTGRTVTPAIQITGGGSSYFSATDSVGGLNLSVSSSAFLFRDSSDNTSAFQIQNAGNVGLFTVDTQNSILTLGGPTNNVTFNNATSSLTLNGNARHTEVIMLTPEYAGAVLDTGATGSNTGTMTSGLDLTNRKNYYLWTTTQATSQSYDVVVQVPIPSNFSAWASTTPLTIDAETGDTTNGTIQVEVRDTSGAVESANNFLGITPSSTNTWQTMTTGAFTGTYTSGGYMTLRIRMYSTSAVTNGVKVGNITLSYLSKW